MSPEYETEWVECEKCGYEAPKGQIEAYNGVCERCKDINIEKVKTETSKAKGENLVDKWKKNNSV